MYFKVEFVSNYLFNQIVTQGIRLHWIVTYWKSHTPFCIALYKNGVRIDILNPGDNDQKDFAETNSNNEMKFLDSTSSVSFMFFE